MLNIESKGEEFVISFEYNPDDPTPHLGEYLQSVEVPSGYYLGYHDGHTSDWMLLRHGSREEAKSTYKRLYMRYFRRQVYMTIVKA